MFNHYLSNFPLTCADVRLTRRQALSAASSALLAAVSGRALAQVPVPEEAGLDLRLKLVREITPEEYDLVRGVAISPDGSHLATLGSVLREPDEEGNRLDHTYIRVFATESGQLVSEIAGRRDGVGIMASSQLTFSSDGKLLGFQEGNSHSIWLTDPQTGRIVRRMKDRRGTSLTFGPDGSEFAQITWSKQVPMVRVSETATGKKRREWTVPKPIGRIAISPNGEYLAMTPVTYQTSVEQPVTLWEWRTGKALGVLDGPGGHLAFHPTRPILAVGGGKTTLYDLASRKPIRTLDVEAESLSFSRDGRVLLTVADHLSLVDVQSGQVARSVVRWSGDDKDWRPERVQFSRDGRYVLGEGWRETEVRSRRAVHVRVWRVDAA